MATDKLIPEEPGATILRENVCRNGLSMALKIGELLIKAKLINETQLAKALEEQRASGGRLGEHLVALEYVTEEDILDCLSQQYGVPSINLKHFDIDESIIRLIPAAAGK